MNLNHFWRRPKYLPYIQPPLTNAMVKDKEKELGFSLPTALIELLKIQNGGYIRGGLGNIPHSQIYGIGPHFPSLKLLQKNIVVFDGDGHWHIGLDYSQNKKSPQVVYLSRSKKILGNTFEEYLSKLKIDSKRKFILETTEPIDEVRAKIAKIANIEFSKPNSWAHGYLVSFGKYEDSLVWVSHNDVKSGFVRKDHLRYEKLKKLMQERTSRFPEAPRESIIIHVRMAKQSKALFKLLKEEGFALKELKNYFK